jgi:hypothetical protein
MIMVVSAFDGYGRLRTEPLTEDEMAELASEVKLEHFAAVVDTMEAAKTAEAIVRTREGELKNSFAAYDAALARKNAEHRPPSFMQEWERTVKGR